MNLKQCLKAGLKLKKVHRALRFSQSQWLKPYIDLNTELRNKATNEFYRDCFKLKINSVFGKTIENVDKRVNVTLKSHWERIGRRHGAEQLIALPHFKEVTVFGENLVAVHFKKTHVIYDKPIFVGFSILDISKTIIYDFYYTFIKNKYENRVSLLYTDTDSLILEVFTQNFYDDMKLNIDKFDTSNYAKTKLHDMPITNSIIGKMKDEFAGIPIVAYYGTAAKTYCIKLPDKDILKAKGITNKAVKKNLTATMYQSVVDGGTDKIFCQMYVFKSRLHTIFTELCNKIALSAHDDKRYAISGSNKTLAWGNREIRLHTLCELLLEAVKSDT